MVSLRILLLVFTAWSGLLPATSAQRSKSTLRKKQPIVFVLPVIKPDQEMEDDQVILPPMPTSGAFKIFRGHNVNIPTAIPVRYELRGNNAVTEWSDSLYIRLHAARPCVAGIRILYRDTVALHWMAANPAKVHEHIFYLGALPRDRVYKIQFLAAWGEVMDELRFLRPEPTAGTHD